MRSIQKRLTALLLAAMLTGAPGELFPWVSAEEPEIAEQRREVSSGAFGAMFTVLGLSFLCAGGMVALIMVKDRT